MNERTAYFIILYFWLSGALLYRSLDRDNKAGEVLIVTAIFAPIVAPVLELYFWIKRRLDKK